MSMVSTGPVSAERSAPPPHDPARAIYQTFLDDMGRLFWQQAWDRLVDYVVFPVRTTSPDGSRDYTSCDRWLDQKREARAVMAARGITEYHRVCKSARFDDTDPHVVTGVHTTYCLRGGTLVVQPFCSALELVWHDTGWRSRAIRTDLRDVSLPITAVGYPDDPVDAAQTCAMAPPAVS